jgi:uncharacterized protein
MIVERLVTPAVAGELLHNGFTLIRGAVSRGAAVSLREPTANEWMRRLGRTVAFPATHQAFLHECLAGDQSRPTALLLRYRAGDYNRLHQDLYGPVAFPLQATLYLSRPGEEFGGAEVVLAEQKPRAQTRVHVLTPDQGDMLVLPTSVAPVAGAKGEYRANFRHGVSTMAWGERFTLGIVLHDGR